MFYEVHASHITILYFWDDRQEPIGLDLGILSNRYRKSLINNHLNTIVVSEVLGGIMMAYESHIR